MLSTDMEFQMTATTPDVIQFAADDAEPAAVFNHDIVGLYNRINRVIQELIGSQSSDVSMTNAFDMDRIAKYLDALDKYHDWVVAQVQLDLPETKGKKYVLELPPVVPAMENEDLEDMVRLFVLVRQELVNSQSARIGSGLPITQDSVRLRATISKARAFLTSYMTPVQPLDLPVSSPTDGTTPQPNRGV